MLSDVVCKAKSHDPLPLVYLPTSPGSPEVADVMALHGRQEQ